MPFPAEEFAPGGRPVREEQATAATLEEQAELRSEGDSPADAEVLREAISPAAYPHLPAALPTLTEPDYAPHFEFGLALLVAGLQASRPRQR
ncbi:TetR/AcrR family transcriptional regulator C-terminal domain-containing protein [Streptomyces sp. NPDC005438]|uniref:TetR/AcrR family transcriptional regulator C-terminal domain-containing protein n=1 Tax=Streptomyces sp. NPDC005438 TaxID=3156880 RepID=UPI0033AA70B0